MKRTKVSVAAVFAAVAMVFAHSSTGEELRYRNGQTQLAASLLLPSTTRPYPAVVIVQGSGTSDRSNRWSRDFASMFVDLGVAVLLTDKRGSGASTGDWRTSSFEDLAHDTLAGVRRLAARDEIDRNRIGVVGLSQGGQVGAIAASLEDEVAFIVSISSKAVGFAEGSFIEMANTARQAGLAEQHVTQVLELNRLALGYIAHGLWEPYQAKRQSMLAGPGAEIAKGFPASPTAPIWTFLEAVADHDPLFYWLQVQQPALIVYGELDETDNAPVAESVRRLHHAFGAAGKVNYEILVVPDVGHSIRDPRTHDLAPTLRSALAKWLVAHQVMGSE